MAEQARTLEDLWAALPGVIKKAHDGAADAEERRWIGSELANDMLEIGVGRILLGEEIGGLGGTLADWIKLGSEIAAADASAGWVASHWAMAAAVVAANGSDELVEEIFSDPKACVASSNLGRLDFASEDEGLRISGTWGFASGCLAATYVGGDLLLQDANAPNGVRMISVLSPRAQADIVETWNPMGLAATGSHQIVYDDVFVPKERIYRWPDSTPVEGRKRGFLGHGAWLISTSVASIHLGLARAAIDAVRTELGEKTNRFTGAPAIAKPSVMRALEEAEGLLFCLRAGLDRSADSVWAEGMKSGKPTAGARMEMRLAALTAVRQGTAIVRSAYDVAGASALQRSGVIQRIFRDANCLIHHIAGSRDGFEFVGRVRHDLDPLSFRV
ncbi:acyl-CoA dehydrogenase family protein [Marimonas lutisalis]|uniref:acyl-CoA dehydrogenase family protein n=1 Tax=Marimonas lutisalis TaxID=2545756 RepID=UPI0010F5DF76|nr:acyl-CoA dehydrogenase family protein [Marimonas lutisalis]